MPISALRRSSYPLVACSSEARGAFEGIDPVSRKGGSSTCSSGSTPSSKRPTSESFGQHSGLGLSISRQIAVALRGSLVAENRRDDGGHVIGARLVLRLPKATA